MKAGVPNISPGSVIYYTDRGSPLHITEQKAKAISSLCAQYKSRLRPRVEKQTNSVTAIARREINSVVSAVRNAGKGVII